MNASPLKIFFLAAGVASVSQLLLSTALLAEPDPGTSEKVAAGVFMPAKTEASEKLLSRLKLPQGFKITYFASGLEAPRMMAVAANGDVYVTRRAPQNDVHLLRDTDGRGADLIRKVASIAIRKLYVAEIQADGGLSEPKEIYNDLPHAGQHPNRTLAVSPAGELFLSIGSTANSTAEGNKESATLLVVKVDGSGLRIFAKGLRNTIGFDWNPRTGELWGMNHGIDFLGNDSQKEELNHLSHGKDYGWPYVFEDGKVNVTTSPKKLMGITGKEYAAKCENSVLGFTAHAAPMAFLFYRGSQFSAEYANSAFVTFHGHGIEANRRDIRCNAFALMTADNRRVSKISSRVF